MPNLPVTPGISWLPTFAFQSPIMKMTSFLYVLVLEGLVGLHRIIQLQLLKHYWLGHRLGLLWYWVLCLGNVQRSFCRLWDCIQVRNFRLLLTMLNNRHIENPVPQRWEPEFYFLQGLTLNRKKVHGFLGLDPFQIRQNWATHFRGSWCSMPCFSSPSS